MNIKVTIGWKSFILKNTNAKIVDDLMGATIIDSTYIDNKRYEHSTNEKVIIQVIGNDDVPSLNQDDIEFIRKQKENGDQDTIES